VNNILTLDLYIVCESQPPSIALVLSAGPGLQWKENLALKASEAFMRRQQEIPNLRKFVYGDTGKFLMFLRSYWYFVRVVFSDYCV